MKALTLGFSPCPNDTFMFDALVHHKIDTEELNFEIVLEDVETLNKKALNSELEITKLSFFTVKNVIDQYQLLSSGSALGIGVGPLFISKKIVTDLENEIKTVAIPGKNTTAYFLFRKFYPNFAQVKEMVFSEIEEAVLSGEVGAGIIIHENRFTYEAKGLIKIADLGELWEQETKLPIPLGGIAIKRELSEEIKKKVERVLKRSIEFAFSNPQSSFEYVKQHGQEMSEDVRKKHIDLYVNSYSIELGEKGKQAINFMLGQNLTEKSIFV